MFLQLSTIASAGMLMAKLSSVSAALYPTKPIASTVYTAGSSASVTWIDNGARPYIKEMSPMRIELYSGNDVHLATLAHNVDPRAQIHTVFMPSYPIYRGAACTLRFVSAHPPTIIYTAKFHIARAPPLGDMSNPAFVQFSNDTVASKTSQTSLLPNSTSSSQPPFTDAGLNAGTTIYAGPLATGSKSGHEQTHSNAGESVTHGKRFNLEVLKFRLVFILWPALIGVSMAL